MKKIEEPNQRIRTLLAITGDTQSDMVRKTGIEKSCICNYVNGKRMARQDKLYLISKAYNVNPAWLMGLDVEMYENDSNEQQNNVCLTYAKKLLTLKESDRDIVLAQIDFLLERTKNGN